MKNVDEIREKALKMLMPDKEAAKVFAAVIKNDRDYRRIFRFTTNQLQKLIMVNPGEGTVIAEFRVELNTFELVVVWNIILGEWDFRIMARCKNDPEINISSGGGTGLTYAVTDQWHKKVMEYLRS